MYANDGPLDSDANALTTVLQPLPLVLHFFLKQDYLSVGCSVEEVSYYKVASPFNTKLVLFTNKKNDTSITNLLALGWMGKCCCGSSLSSTQELLNRSLKVH